MAETLYIQHSPEETRIALAEDGRVIELQVERTVGRGLSGNIYRGRVVRVVPSMDAAFVDIGHERNALLHAADVWLAGFESSLASGATTVDGAPVRRPRKPIAELLSANQEIMVQVVREPVARKGPRVTTYIALPGRNIVHLPREPHFGVSRMIDDPAERKRLHDVVAALCKRGGAIVRTVGEGATIPELGEDLRVLEAQWLDIQVRFEAANGPSYIYDDLDLVLRSLRDLVGPQTETVWIDDPAEYDRVTTFVGRFHPEARPHVRLHEARTPLFSAHGIDRWLRAAIEPRVALKSGGELVISRTEAMTVIDVNSDRQVSSEALSDAVLRLNLEAAREVAHQLRLRNIGGIVVVDFVEMKRLEDRRMLEAVVEAELAGDRARIRVGKLNEFGLIELTRKRVRESIYERLTETCPTCDGQGYVRSASDLAIDTIARLRRSLASGEHRDSLMKVELPARAAAILKSQLAPTIADLEERFGVSIEVVEQARVRATAPDVRVVSGRSGGRG